MLRFIKTKVLFCCRCSEVRSDDENLNISKLLPPGYSKWELPATKGKIVASFTSIFIRSILGVDEKNGVTGTIPKIYTWRNDNLIADSRAGRGCGVTVVSWKNWAALFKIRRSQVHSVLHSQWRLPKTSLEAGHFHR